MFVIGCYPSYSNGNVPIACRDGLPGHQLASLAQRQYPIVYSSGSECRTNISEECVDLIGVDLNLELLAALPAADLFRRTQIVMTRAMAKNGEARKSGAVVSCKQPIDNRLSQDLVAHSGR